jgi:hypothetical protein
MVQTPCSVRAVMEAMPGRELAYRVTCTLTLYADLPYADWELTLHDKPADPWPEAGWLCLPFRCAAPRFHLGRLGALVDPANDLVPGTNFDLLALDTGLALAEASGRGVGLCALDNALISLGRPGCWRYSAQPTAPESSVYVNLFNNQWTTNFRLWNQGTWTARVRLWAFGKYQAARAITVPSAEARSPLLTAWVDAPAGTLPLTGRGLEVSPAGALVTAFGPNPDGPGTLVRLWEYSGRDGSCTVRLPEGLKARRVQPVDLRGRPKGAPMPVYKQSFKARLHAFATGY